MARVITLCLLVGLFLAGPVEAAEGLSAEVVGVMVIKKDPSSKYGGSFVPGLRGGVSVYLRIATSGKSILKIDSKASILGTFQTDKGTRLMPTKSRFGRPGWLRSTMVARDGKSCNVTIASEIMPKAGAAAVVIKGSLAVVLSGEVKTVTIADVALAKGTKVKGGPLPLTISEYKESKWQKGKQQLTLQSDQPMDAIKGITFLGADGKEIKSATGSTMKMGIGGKYTYSKSFYIEGKPEKATLKIEVYSDMTTVKVPLALKAGLAL